MPDETDGRPPLPQNRKPALKPPGIAFIETLKNPAKYF
jgi:hypothetical protein